MIVQEKEVKKKNIVELNEVAKHFAVEFSHESLYSFFSQIEVIQEQLDLLS